MGTGYGRPAAAAAAAVAAAASRAFMSCTMVGAAAEVILMAEMAGVNSRALGLMVPLQW
jgi:hypothetical protein